MILLKLQPGHGKITWLRVYDYELFALLRLAFAPAPALPSLNLARNRNSQAHSTKGTPSHPCGCFDLLWAYGFRFYFTPLTGVLFAFPSRYYSLSVAASCLALDRGRPGFRQGFSGLAVLRNQSHEVFVMSRTGLSPSSTGLPMPFRYDEDFSLREVLHVPPDDSCNPQPATACTLTPA